MNFITKFFVYFEQDDIPLLLSINKMAAVRRRLFDVIRASFKIRKIADLSGHEVDLENIVAWIIREVQLYNPDIKQKEIEMNIKLDGRPFWGKYYFGKKSSLTSK